MVATDYRVQFKTNLADATWHDLPGTVTNANSRAWLQDQAPGANRRFYRIVRMP
jgi:hypothetical protein